MDTRPTDTYKEPILAYLIIERVEDEEERQRLKAVPGRTVLVESDDLVYRVIGEEWKAIGRLTVDGRIRIGGLDYGPRIAYV
ncbi:MAG: hypothetical protein HY548_04625 [Elusimicrobia bacterium]|nr:hypothetical protein [Elusimicrobiota bacterium]